MNTTLNQIRAYHPCGVSYTGEKLTGFLKLRDSLGANPDPDALITITQIIDSNGVEDAFWCLRAVKGWDSAIRLFGVQQIRKVQHLLTDPRSLNALDVAEKFVLSLATTDKLDAAYINAGNAACSYDLAAPGKIIAARWCASAVAAPDFQWVISDWLLIQENLEADLRKLCKECE